MIKKFKDNTKKFYLLPALFFTDEKYKNLDSDSILLYTILLDRTTNTSINAGGIDDEDNLYVIASFQELQATLNISQYKFSKIKKELIAHDLIQICRNKISEPEKIYVKNID